jgi:hypothetical protein
LKENDEPLEFLERLAAITPRPKTNLLICHGVLAPGAHWRHCGGRLRLIAMLHEPAVIRKILAHLDLAHSGQSPGPAPPESSAAAP